MKFIWFDVFIRIGRRKLSTARLLYLMWPLTEVPWHNFYCCHLPLLNGHCLHVVPENIHIPPTGGNRNCKGWVSRRRKFPRRWGWLLQVFSLGAPSKIGNYQKQQLCWPSYQLVYCLQSLNIVFIDDLFFTVSWMIFLHPGFVRVLKTLENPWISGVRFQGLESTWISFSVLESPWVFIKQDRKCSARSVNPKHRC